MIFNLNAKVTISVYTTVEANSLEEAIALAEQRVIEQAQWGDEEQQNICWVSDEYDGEVYNIDES